MPLIWSAVPCRARSKGSRAWSRNAHSETEPSPSPIACKAWMSFSDIITSPKPSVASDRLRPPGCAPVRALGVEGIPALNQPKGQDYDHPDASQPAMGFAPGRRAICVLARYAEHDDAAPGALAGYCRKHPCFDGTARRERSPAPRPVSRYRAGTARRPVAGTDAPGLWADLQSRGDALPGIVFPREQSAGRDHRGRVELQSALHPRG